MKNPDFILTVNGITGENCDIGKLIYFNGVLLITFCSKKNMRLQTVSLGSAQKTKWLE